MSASLCLDLKRVLHEHEIVMSYARPKGHEKGNHEGDEGHEGEDGSAGAKVIH